MPRHLLLLVLAALLLLLPPASCRLLSGVEHTAPSRSGELHDALCHSHHCRQLCLTAARRADEQGAREAARLFVAIASAQHIHEQLYRSALGARGGEFSIVDSLPFVAESAAQNLRAAHRELDYCFSAAIATLLESGNRYGARLMIRHAASENRMRRLIDLLLNSGDSAARRSYGLCPRCGFLTAAPYRDPYCPQCLLSESRFLEF